MRLNTHARLTVHAGCAGLVSFALPLGSRPEDATRFGAQPSTTTKESANYKGSGIVAPKIRKSQLNAKLRLLLRKPTTERGPLGRPRAPKCGTGVGLFRPAVGAVLERRNRRRKAVGMPRDWRRSYCRRNRNYARIVTRHFAQRKRTQRRLPRS